MKDYFPIRNEHTQDFITDFICEDGKRLRVYYDGEDLLLNGNDAAAIAGFRSPRSALKRHCEDVVKLPIEITTGQRADGSDARQTVMMSFIDDDGFFELLSKSKLSEPDVVSYCIWRDAISGLIDDTKTLFLKKSELDPGALMRVVRRAKRDAYYYELAKKVQPLCQDWREDDCLPRKIAKFALSGEEYMPDKTIGIEIIHKVDDESLNNLLSSVMGTDVKNEIDPRCDNCPYTLDECEHGVCMEVCCTGLYGTERNE